MNTQRIETVFPEHLVRLLLFSFMALVLTIVNTHAQEIPKQDKDRVAQQQDDNRDASKKAFIDEDGDGLRDQPLRKRDRRGEAVDERQERRKRRDHFIDMDGDGINDNRCNGMGIMRGQRHGKAQVEEK